MSKESFINDFIERLRIDLLHQLPMDATSDEYLRRTRDIVNEFIIHLRMRINAEANHPEVHIPEELI